MLTHFLDIIYPAFSGGYMRGKEGELPIYSFGDIKVRKINDENVLVGNYIKDTQYNVRTIVENGELKSTPTDVPTAPYSRFIIFLKNHRMVLLRYETMSPDISSFQATVMEI